MPKTILLADDSVTIQKVVGISFASEDATVVSVDNGDAAIAKAREIRPDIVLADVVMPGKNGYEVCDAIRKDPELAHIPVLLLTGTFEAFDEARARAVGSSGHISKPFEAASLVAEVRRLIESAPRKPPAAARAEPQGARGSQSAADDAFDFFDDEVAAADVAPALLADAAADDLDFQGFDSGIAFADESEREDPRASSGRAAGAQAARPDTRAARAASTSASQRAPLDAPHAAAPLADLGDSLDDSLAPDASRSGDQPFDFAFAGEAAESTDPLAELDLMPQVGDDDLAQATVIDPLGASGYDVSSSDLGSSFGTSAPQLDAQRAPQRAPQQDWTEARRRDEAEATVIARDALRDTDPIPLGEPAAAALGDLTTVVGDDPVFVNFAKPQRVDVAVSVEGTRPAVERAPARAAEPASARAITARAPRAAEAVDALIARVGPELRQQLHETLEKIAWESFGDLTEAIVRQSVERVESIAWEVIPRMAETLIEDEIRRMKAEPEDA
ncbi:MAG TPA: response regulator [Myxococcota bacterium]|nr:response regulator [Myxococcota bacterium]